MTVKSVQIENPLCVCEPDECDAFNFMAKKLGIKVLHPGGLATTEELARQCNLSRDMTLLDVGCGRGSSAVFLAKRYGCRVVGVDVDQNLLLEANSAAYRKGVSDRVAFKHADIHDLQFEDDTFDGAIVQAVLVFTKKAKALQQLIRKVHLGGFVGIVELAWKRPPTNQIVTKARNTICDAVANAENHQGWIELLRQSGLTIVDSKIQDVKFTFRDIIRNEGFISTLSIAFKSTFNKAIGNKMSEIADLFREIHDYLGYGMYIGRKE